MWTCALSWTGRTDPGNVVIVEVKWGRAGVVLYICPSISRHTWGPLQKDRLTWPMQAILFAFWAFRQRFPDHLINAAIQVQTGTRQLCPRDKKGFKNLGTRSRVQNNPINASFFGWLSSVRLLRDLRVSKSGNVLEWRVQACRGCRPASLVNGAVRHMVSSKQQAWRNIASAVQRVESTHLANCVSGAQRVGGRCFCVIIPTSLLGLKRSHTAVINNRSLC